ncbi:unnamed protein product [Aphanomyces euteiches]
MAALHVDYKTIPHQSSSTSLSEDDEYIAFNGSPRTTRWRFQMALINLIEFAAESSRGLVLPTLFLYCESLGGTLVDMGLITSVFSIGRLVSSMAFGWLCDRVSFRTVYMLSAFFGVIGNLVYVMADRRVANSLGVLTLSRFIVGFGAGNRSVCRADVARMTSVDQRLQYITILCMVVFLGYALTPGFGSILVGFDITLFHLHLDALTAPGFLLAGLNFIMLCLMAVGYDDTIDQGDAPLYCSRGKMTASRDSGYELPQRLVYFGVAVFMFLNVIGRGVLSVYETINVPLYLQVTGLSNSTAAESAATFQFQLGLLGLLSYLAIEFFRLAISDTTWLLIGLGSLALGNALLFLQWPLSLWELSLSLFFIWSVGSPLLTAVSVAAFSKILGRRQQGTWMGLLGSTASVSRIVLPLLPALFSTFLPMFWLGAILSVVGIILLVWYSLVISRAKSEWKRLVAIFPAQSQESLV